MEEYPDLRFSKTAAGIMRTRASQFQFSPAHSGLKIAKEMMMITAVRLQGNNKKVEGWVLFAMIYKYLDCFNNYECMDFYAKSEN